MKDSQLPAELVHQFNKYIKVNNERFSTVTIRTIRSD